MPSQRLYSVNNPRNLLIPSIHIADLGALKEFGRHFREVELDLYGMSREMGAKEQRQLSEARSLINGEGLKVYSVHLRSLNLSKPSATTPDVAVFYCNTVHSMLAPKFAVLHPGKGDMQTLLSNLGYVLARIPPEMAIVVENMTSPEAVLSSPETIREFVERGQNMLPMNFGVCVDTTHPAFRPYAGETAPYTSLVLEHMDAASERLRHLHFSDRAFTEGETGKHLPIGKGVIDWARIDGYLRNKGYGGRAAIEIRFTDGVSDKIVSSLFRYCACAQKSFNPLDGNESMAGQSTIGMKEFLEKIAKLPSLDKMPASLLKLLNLPSEGRFEESEDFKYLVVPSPSYGGKHADPYDVLTGESMERLDWASYVFGVRYHGTYLSAVLIDKERKISVATTILGAYGEWKQNWPIFEKAILRALESAGSKDLNERIILDHINLTSVGDIEYIEAGDPRAWKKSL